MGMLFLYREGIIHVELPMDTGRGVTVFDPEGEKIQSIPVPVGWTANVTFGGSDGRLLFITASKAVFGIRMRTAGVSPFN